MWGPGGTHRPETHALVSYRWMLAMFVGLGFYPLRAGKFAIAAPHILVLAVEFTDRSNGQGFMTRRSEFPLLAEVDCYGL